VITRAAADALAAELELDVDDLAICHACLSFVSFAIAAVAESGPRSQVVRAIVRRLAADLSAHAKGDLFRMGWQPWPPRSLGV
jgi:hypothetical protein